MALPINISDLINRRVIESARIEYKGDWNPEPILHSICAFANDIDNWGGGYIVIGIEEENGMPKLPVKGLSKSSIDRINKELLQKCNLIEPRYIPVVEQTSYEGKEIIVLWIPGGADRPYKCPIAFPTEKSVKSEKVYYIRKMSNSIRANQLEEKELFMLANNQPYDDRPNPAASNEDLMNRRLISRRYRNRRIGDFLKELKLVEGRNTGIPTILNAMEMNGSEMPSFETDEDRAYFTVILPIHKKFLMPGIASAPRKKQRRSLPELKELVVVTLAENGMLSTSELASELGYTKITSTLSKAIKELMEEGIVQYSEPEKLRSKKQKLYLVREHRNEF